MRNFTSTRNIWGDMKLLLKQLYIRRSQNKKNNPHFDKATTCENFIAYNSMVY